MLSKMPGESAKKTRSAPKVTVRPESDQANSNDPTPEQIWTPSARLKLFASLGGIFLLCGVIFLVALLWPMSNQANTPADVQHAAGVDSDARTKLPEGCSGLYVAQQCLEIMWARTSQERLQGLSGKASIADNQAMIFVFDQPMQQCFWMKDMKFAIDMIWLNEAKQVVRVKQNVSPQTYPESFCADNTKYVVEVGAGRADALGIETGKQLNFY